MNLIPFLQTASTDILVVDAEIKISNFITRDFVVLQSPYDRSAERIIKLYKLLQIKPHAAGDFNIVAVIAFKLSRAFIQFKFLYHTVCTSRLQIVTFFYTTFNLRHTTTPKDISVEILVTVTFDKAFEIIAKYLARDATARLL